MRHFPNAFRRSLIAFKNIPWRNKLRFTLSGHNSDAINQRLANADKSQEDKFLNSVTAAGGVVEKDDGPALPESISVQKLRSLGVLWPDEIDRICAEQKQTQFLVEEFLPAQSIAIAAGESTIGKSPLLCQLGLCIAAGVPFLGLSTRRARVLYFDLENSLTDGKAMRDSLMKLLRLKVAPSEFLIATEPPPNLESLIAAVKPGLIMIDSLRAFRPEVTAKNAPAGVFLKDIRQLARKYDCTFLIIHHLRKPNKEYPVPELEECTVANWLAEMEGPRAFVNQTDVRIAIAEGDREPTALKLKWSRRVHGDMPMVLLERVHDEDAVPLGYQQLTGIGLLSEDRQQVFEALPNEFATGDARKALKRGDEATDNFLNECKRLRLVEKVRRGRWRKLSQGEHQSNQVEKAEKPVKASISIEIPLHDPLEKA